MTDDETPETCELCGEHPEYDDEAIDLPVDAPVRRSVGLEIEDPRVAPEPTDIDERDLTNKQVGGDY